MTKNLPHLDCPLEARVMSTLHDCGLTFTRPERDKTTNVTYDFWVEELGVFIEIHRFDSERTQRQIVQNRENPVIVLVGEKSVNLFCEMLHDFIFAPKSQKAMHVSELSEEDLDAIQKATVGDGNDQQ